MMLLNEVGVKEVLCIAPPSTQSENMNSGFTYREDEHPLQHTEVSLSQLDTTTQYTTKSDRANAAWQDVGSIDKL